ncbi:MAG: DUF11 domain-containing protein [Myxococcota bacterium]|nr:DUF11 domain-containing protein [Myxococcota bacterium]
MRTPHSSFTVLAAAAIGLLASTAAWSGPDYAASSEITEPNGFPGVCNQPCYVAGIETEVWLPSNPDNPAPSAGNQTYVYKVTHTGGEGPLVPALVNFELAVDLTEVASAGYIATSPGIEPSGVQLFNGAVTWEFTTTPISDGEASKLLYVHSPLMPGAVENNSASVAGQAALDAPGSCLGPLDPPGPQCSLSVEKEGCVVQAPDVPGDGCEGKVTSFTFQYTGLGCDASSHLQNPRKVRCIGGAASEEPVNILVSSKKRKRWSWDSGWWGKKRHRKTVFASETGVLIGDSIVVDAANGGKHKIGSKTYVSISSGSGSHDVIELDKFHTSCSQPFGPGMVFGSVQITSVTSTQGGTVSLPDPEEDECSTSIDLIPPPHCLGKIKNLELRYTGGDCSQSLNTQATTKTGCVDATAPSASPVRVILSDGKLPPPNSSVYLDQNMVSGGDILTVDASLIPSCSYSGTLKSVTGYWVKDAVTDELIQDGFFHTSCSQPLNLGDQFGALQVFGLDSTNGGTVALGSEVEYSYVVTNPNAAAAENVSLDDDILGNIATGVTIPAGESVTFTTTALVEVETTNIATVSGQVASQVCSEGTDSATITVVAAPEEPQICTKKIAAMLLRYTGPDIAGATVKLVAKSFHDDPVIYAGVDLTDGTVLSSPSENGFTIDGTAHGESSLGSKTSIYINGVLEKIHTSCSVPFATNQPAPLNDPAGAPSPNWYVVDFTEKMKHKDHHHHHHGHHD